MSDTRQHMTLIGKLQSHHIRGLWTFVDAAELIVSNGVSSMGHRIEPNEMRDLAKWLTALADRIEGRPVTARPVVTMDLDTGRLFVEGTCVGHVDESAPGVCCTFACTLTATDLRAIADFLEQLEGANLLSGISEAGE